jgi:hypothetical protein
MAFQLDIARFINKLGAEKGKVLRKTTVAAYQGMTTSTRVDTGRARMNYNVSLGEPNGRTQEAPQNAPSQGTPAGAEEQRNSGIVGVLAEIRSGRINDVYVANGLPYIWKLNGLDDMTGKTIRGLKQGLESGAMA